MRIDIVNGDIVTGDGKTHFHESSVIIEDGIIVDTPRQPYLAYNFSSHRVINAEGGIIMPGIINPHAHVLSFGPTFPWGMPGAPLERIISNLNTHLLQGTTTILNNDGYALPFENEAINKLHPMNVKRSTIHTPKNIYASELITGHRLADHYRNFTAEESVELGAVALGEIGSPGSAYGTFEKTRRTGRVISARAAEALDDAYMRNDESALLKAGAMAGLEHMDIDELQDLVRRTSLDPVNATNEAILEAVEYSHKLNVPALCHTEPPTYDSVFQAAEALGPLFVAQHVNHNATVEQAVQVATEIKKHGGHVEIFPADSFGAKQINPDPTPGFTLLEKGLVDMICTDYMGGYHDSMLTYIKKAVEHGVATLPEMVRLCTSSTANIIPRLAPNKGLIEPGKVADLIIVDQNDVSNVRCVIIGGRVVVENGQIVV